MKALIAAVAAVALMASVGSAALAKGHKGGQHRDDAGTGLEIGVEVAFSVDDRNAVQRYFESHSVVPDHLPPGIAKNLARGKPLPPGIAKKVLPGELLAELPPRSGYDYVLVGADVLLVDMATHIVADILRDAIRR